MSAPSVFICKLMFTKNDLSRVLPLVVTRKLCCSQKCVVSYYPSINKRGYHSQQTDWLRDVAFIERIKGLVDMVGDNEKMGMLITIYGKYRKLIRRSSRWLVVADEGYIWLEGEERLSHTMEIEFKSES